MQTALRITDYSRLARTLFARPSVLNLAAIVVGAGALGNEVVKALGLLGVHAVFLVDPDHVRPSDLSRSVFFRDTDCIGRSKAATVAETAQRWFPDTGFEALECEIADVGYGKLLGKQILFSCVDNDLARLEIACIATALGLAVCDAGLGTPNYSHGRVSWFPGGAGACFGCRLTERKRRELLTFWDATVRPCSNPVEAEVAPSTPTMASITGSLQVELGLRWLTEKVLESTTFELSLDAEPRSSQFTSPRSRSCPFHDEIAAPRVDLPNPDATFEDLLQSVGGDASVILDWPIILRLRCLDCSTEWAPMRRAAAVRRHCICPGCGSQSILEQESIRIIERDSRWARVRPSALGLPADHRYLVRFRNGGR